ncbi:MAG: hypothetical protein HXK78_05210 [Lachnospiraceae bacterium]|nr:hypothetical protein [Lachnospiraceae bacterium]
MEKFVSKLKLKDIRSYISKIDPIQILQEDNSYEKINTNYFIIKKLRGSKSP